jgi:hypothetical protein
MPNWIYNNVIISHKDSNKIISLYNELLKGVNSNMFNHIMPRPEEEDKNWYKWNNMNWGTKWDAYNLGDPILIDMNTVSINFDTAWNPPILLYEYMHLNEYHIDALFEEESNGSIYGKWVDRIYTKLEKENYDF